MSRNRMMDSQRACSTGELTSDGCGLVGSGRTMHHSHSTPAGVDGGARTPPATPKKGGKMLAVRVQMLDDSITMFQIQAKALGRVLFDQVCKQLHLLEADYFGLEYQDLAGTRYWLDLQKPVSRQLGLSLIDPLLRFCVKFYTPDPGQLEEEFTRYLFCLQIKRDLSQAHLQCNDNTAALMASYIVQAECGDYVAEDYPDHTYLSSYKFVPHQDHELECRIMENHKKHAGQSPAEADLNLLETARRCELYGMKMHPAKDHDGITLNLSVAHMGIVVFQHFSKINTFSWAKIRKISFKRKRFLIKLHPESYGVYKDLVEFYFEGRNECKNFWKKCVEHHGFFRCAVVKNISRHKTRVISRGSSFRYSGKTQKQMVEFVRDNYVKRQTFQRSASFRHSAHSSAVNVHAVSVGTSISAHPLLPLADPSLAEELDKASRMESARAGRGASQTTKLAYRRQGTATHSPRSSITLGTLTPDSPTVLVEDTTVTTSSPSPPLTTQSVSVEICTSTSRVHDAKSRGVYRDEDIDSSTGQKYIPTSYITTHTHTTIPPMYSNETNIITNSSSLPHNIKYTPKSEGSLYYINPIQPDTTSTHSQTVYSHYNDHFEYNQTLPKSHLDCRTAPDYSYDHLSYKQNNSQLWQRSASCRDLYDFTFENQIQSKTKTLKKKSSIEKNNSQSERKLESPVTRYDDSHKSLYNVHSNRNTSLDIQQDIIVLDHKIYSSSYPGTVTLSQESMEDPGNYELAESQDDLSHDSYELLERSDDDLSSTAYRYRHSYPSDKTRSGSLDSGNYIQSVSDSDDSDHIHHYKSTSDVHQDIFMMDDPRDLPREKNPPKSDGSFYRTVKLSSRTSSLESKSDYYDSMGSSKKLSKVSSGSRTSSLESKSDRESKQTKKCSEPLEQSKTTINIPSPKIVGETLKSSSSNPTEFIFPALNNDYNKQTNNDTAKTIPDYDSFPLFKETTPHVHSVSLQNVETEQNIRNHRAVFESELNTIPRTQRTSTSKSTHIWPENICGLPTEIQNLSESASRSAKSDPGQSSKSIAQVESNIFSFDDDKIKELKDSDYADGLSDQYPYPPLPILDNDLPEPIIPESFPIETTSNIVNDFIDNSKSSEQLLIDGEDMDKYQAHLPIERTKSDPNNITNRPRLGPNSRRHTLMHQKSIDLTPAESSDEDYLYRQIPSAPPLSKGFASHFEMPTAEFGHFDILQRDVEGTKTKFEVPKSQFEVLGAKTQFDLINLPPKDSFDIPYILHKRHVMNGTAPKVEPTNKVDVQIVDVLPKRKLSSDVSSPKNLKPELEKALEEPIQPPPQSQFLFTQNVDLSNINPITLEIDKNDLPVLMSSPKRDITKIDPSVLETLNMKLSRIESDSPPHSFSIVDESKTTTNKVDVKLKIDAKNVLKAKYNAEIINKARKDAKDGKPKRINKPRSQNKKSSKNKGKVRITSFSSDDESLDSDDVFGSAEATPTKLEFSPPQHRKEMESILKYESERQTHLQYTMSSTEIEGSPPQPRKSDILPYDRSLDVGHTELRRISERSLSIPSSEEDGGNLKPPLQTLPEAKDLSPSPDKETPIKNIEANKPSSDKESPVEKPSTINISSTLLGPSEMPTTTVKSTEIIQTKLKSFLADADTTLIRRGQAPGLFAHARLNLSEGTGFMLMQRQTAVQSPTSSRRAKSLDTAVVSVTNLPPPNAFSSKDDTLDSLETDDSIDKDILKSTTSKSDLEKTPSVEAPKLPSDDEVLSSPPPPKEDKEVKEKVCSDVEEQPKKDESKAQVKASKLGLKIDTSIIKSPNSSKTSTPTSGGVKKSPKGTIIKDKSLEKQKSPKLKTAGILRAVKSQESEQSKKQPKEKSKSFEKLELKRVSSKERSKSQDDNELSIRRKKQQILYETAIKQTKTLKSPVKETLPTFPIVEDSVSVSDGKLEIKIDVTNFTIPDDAIIITKSPKKLDKKLTKSLELNFPDDPFGTEKQVGRLGKSLDLEQRKTEIDSDSKPGFSTEAGDTSEETSDIESETNDPIPPGDMEDVPPDIIADIQIPNSSSESKHVLSQPTLSVEIDDIKSTKSTSPDTKPISGSLSPATTIPESISEKRIEKDIPIRIIPKIKSTEEESLTEVSDIRGDLIKKLSTERSRSEDTASWITVECEEVIGLDDEEDLSLHLNDEDIIPEDPNFLHTNQVNAATKNRMMKFGDTRSRSSDTTGSWTSGEKDPSPVQQPGKSDESSVSCSIIRPFGISQQIEIYETREQLENELLKNLSQEVQSDSSEKAMSEKALSDKAHSEKGYSSEKGSSDKSSRSPLKRSSPVDEESSSSGSGGNGNKPLQPPEVFITHKQSLLNTKTSSKSSTDTSSLTVSSFEHDGKVLKGKYPFEQKWLSEKELQKGRLRSYSRISSASDRSTYSSLEDSMSGGSFDKRNGSLDKPRIRSIDNLSIESKNSLDTESRLDTESSSGSLGVAYRLQKTGEAPTIEASSTWRPFLIDSESSSVEDGLLPPDQDLEDKEYFLSRDSYARFRCDDDEDTMTNLDDVNTPGIYGPSLQQSNTADVVPNYGHTAYLSRTLSRISERSSNSEKSSLDENSSKHSHYDSMNEESLVSSDQPASLSSDSSSADAKPINEDLPKAESSINKKISSSSSIERSPSNKNSSGDKFKPQSLLGCNLTRQISDDRRTSAEMADLSLDEVELIMAEDKLRRQNSDDTIIEENSEEEEECGTPQLKCSSSQESEDWPLPEIPVTASSSNLQSNQPQRITPLSSMEGDSPPRIPIMEDYQLPKVFGLRGSLQSQDSGQWPSPPSSAVYDPPPEYVGDFEVGKTYYIQAEKACKVVVQDSISDATPELENEVFVDQTLIDELSKGKSDGSESDNSFDLPKNEILLDTKYSSEEEAVAIAAVVVKPPIPPKKHGMLSKQTTIQQVSPHSSDEDRSNSENITKSDGVSLSESKNMTTVLFQNISGSYSGTSKSFKGPGGLKDDDSSLFDNLSLSEWSSSNSHPLGPNSPHSKSSLTHDLDNGQKSTTPEKMGTFTKSTERPVKIPPAVTSPTAVKEDGIVLAETQQSSTHSTKVSLQQVKSLQKSVSYDQNKCSTNSTFKSNSNFKTVPLVRSHRSSGIAKKSSTIPCELASTSSSNVSVSSTSDEHSKRKGSFTQVRKSKLLRQKSNDTILKHKDDSDSEKNPDNDNLENSSSQNNNNNSLYNISSNSTLTSPDSQQPTTTVLNNSVYNNINGNHVDENGKKKYRWPTDKSFFIAKEILMTEKIYKKDLDVINEYWRNEFGTEEMEEVAELLLSLVAPLATVHAVFARDLDSCLQGWENHTLPLGDILLNNIPTLLPLYEEYLDGHTLVLEQLDIAFRRNPRFEQLYRDFELQKVCYLPFTSFILKPLHRLLQYQNLIDRLLESYDENRSDRASCIAARAALTPLLSPAKETLKHSENLATLYELQRDIVGFDILGASGRNFLRLGCLLKHSRKGYQQRMFFLFSDILLYTSRVQGAAHFRVHGHMPLRGVMIDEPEKPLTKYAFTIYGGNRALTVAANSQYEKDCWVTDLQDALQKARDHTDSNLTYLSLKSCCSSDEIIDKQGLDGCSSTERAGIPIQRNNTTVQVCWHRNTTISMVDQLLSIKNQLSGYLLRKFKNSNGWQKLWVVFTSFCLFFYKSSTEDFPLASLPVLGYTIGTPSPNDNISKEFVFKLQYKNHVYFFRSESNYTFQRWLEVIGSATNRSGEQNGNELTPGF